MTILRPRFPEARAGLRRHGGFSLLEVLIAIVIVGIGLLGLAALQSFSIKANQSANFRTKATALAYDLLDRMRANRTEVVAGRYYTVYTSAPANCPAPANPSPTQTTATRDLLEWKCALQNELPEGQGRVQMTGGTVSVAIRWIDARWASTPAGQLSEFSLTSSL